MADECLNLVKEQQVSSWNRATVADGIWLQQNTIAPLETRDEVIAGYIDNTLGGIKSDVAAMGEAVAAMNEEVTTMKTTKQDKIHAIAPFILDPETNELELAIDTETLEISGGELKVIGGGSEPEGSAFTKMQLTHKSSTTEKETVNIKDWEDTLYITDGGGIITTAKSSGTTTVGFKTSSFKAIKESVFTGSTLIYFDNPNGEKKLYYVEPSESRVYNVVPTIWYDEQGSLQKSNLIVLDDASFTELDGIVCLDEHDQLFFPAQSDPYTEYFYYIKDQETLVYYAKDTDGTRQASKCTGSKDLVIATLDDLPGDSELDEETNRLVIKNADLITDIETHKEKEFSYYCKETETLYTAKSTDDTPTVWYWEEHIYRSGFHIVETAAEVPEDRSQHDNYSTAYYCIETNQMTSGGYLPGASWYTVDVVDLAENRKELQIGINTGNGVTINADNKLVVNVDDATIKLASSSIAAKLAPNGGIDINPTDGMYVKVDGTTITITDDGKLASSAPLPTITEQIDKGAYLGVTNIASTSGDGKYNWININAKKHSGIQNIVSKPMGKPYINTFSLTNTLPYTYYDSSRDSSYIGPAVYGGYIINNQTALHHLNQQKQFNFAALLYSNSATPREGVLLDSSVFINGKPGGGLNWTVKEETDGGEALKYPYINVLSGQMYYTIDISFDLTITGEALTKIQNAVRVSNADELCIGRFTHDILNADKIKFFTAPDEYIDGGSRYFPNSTHIFPTGGTCVCLKGTASSPRDTIVPCSVRLSGYTQGSKEYPYWHAGYNGNNESQSGGPSELYVCMNIAGSSCDIMQFIGTIRLNVLCDLTGIRITSET